MRKPAFIIAEIGINHNGDLDIAKKLVLAAKSSGADAVKFQKRTIERVYTNVELDKPRESPWGTTNRQQKEGLELNITEYNEIAILCKSLNFPWFVSPWDLQSVDEMARYGLSYWKIPSALITHKDLCTKVAALGKKTFISTGMSTMEEILRCVDIFRAVECPFELMHCNAQYPLPEDERVNLKCIRTLRDYFHCDVGYSGHESGIINAVAAVAMGATSIEKHLTLDRTMYGSDQAASVEPGGFHRMWDYIRCVERCMGDGLKRVTVDEEKCKSKLRREGDVEYN
jgi:N-acetylneuraminate synthase